MKYSYYPGCTLKTKAQKLDQTARLAAAKLGIEMEEIAEWQCCGAVYPLAEDEIASKLPSVRALVAAKEKEQPLLTLCSGCHHVIKRVNDDMKTNAEIRTRANNYLALETPYAGETRVVHYLEMLRDDIGFDAIKKAVVNPLTGRKIAAFYGCMLLRPSGVMAFDNPENPSLMENFITAIGATPVVFPFRNECCGGYVTMEDNAMAQKQVERVMKSAQSAGAEEIITACPLCLYNLVTNATDTQIPVTYFTELLAEALGVRDEEAQA